MIEINIAKDFTTTPGARNISDGKYSGEEFFNDLLLPNYKKAIEQKVKLKIILDGTDGYASSFLNEAFIRLGNLYNADDVWQNLIIVSNEIPKYLTKVKNSIYERRS